MIRERSTLGNNIPIPPAGYGWIFLFEDELYIKKSDGTVKKANEPGGSFQVPLSNTAFINEDVEASIPEERIFKTYDAAVAWIVENGNLSSDNQWQIMLSGRILIEDIQLHEFISILTNKLDPTNFNKNLDSSVTDIQKLAQKLNDLSFDGVLTKIGEINCKDFNDSDGTYVKVQFAGAVPPEKYYNCLFYKFIERFETYSGGYSGLRITKIENDQTVSIINEVDSVLVDNFNSKASSTRDIDINVTLSGENTQDWMSGRLGVWGLLKDIPEMIERIRLLNLTVNFDSSALAGVSVIIDDEIKGVTDVMGQLSVSVTDERFTLALVKEGYQFMPEIINAGTADLTLTKEMIQPIRLLTLTVTDDQDSAIAGVSVSINGEVAGQTNDLGIFTGNVPNDGFNILLTKNRYASKMDSFTGGTDPLVVTEIIQHVRFMQLNVTDQLGNPLNRCNILIDDVSIGQTSDIGLFEGNVTIHPFTLKIEKNGYYFIPVSILAGTDDFSIVKQMIAVRNLDLLVTDDRPMHTPIAGADIFLGEMNLGTTGPTGHINTLIPQAETTLTISKEGYTTSDFSFDAGIIDIERTVTLTQNVG